MEIKGDFTYLEKRRKEFLNELSPRAVYRNGAWMRLEDMGFDYDFSESDAGEPPKGA